MIRYMVRDEVWQGVHCEFYQFSKGLHVVYSISEHAFKEFTFNDEEVADDRLFNVGLQRFHYKNFDDNFHVPMAEVEKNRKPRVIATSSRQVIDEYLSEHQHLDHRAGERLVILP